MVVLRARGWRQLHGLERAQETQDDRVQIRRGERQVFQRSTNRTVSDELGIDGSEKSMNTLLSQEVSNRFERLPPAEKTPAAMVRITVEVTCELLYKQPERVEEFLRLCSVRTH